MMNMFRISKQEKKLCQKYQYPNNSYTMHLFNRLAKESMRKTKGLQCVLETLFSCETKSVFYLDPASGVNM